MKWSRRWFLGLLGGMPIFLPAQRARSEENRCIEQTLLLPGGPHGRPGPGGKIVEARTAEGIGHSADFYRAPQLSLMVGFIKDPEHRNYALEQWAQSIGSEFDARKLAGQAKAAGMVEIIWYDKWIDGLVFHKTRTTSFRTSRDFLADLAPECKRAGLRLILYFNTFYDGNPEFSRWACKDQRGEPLVFSPFWPANLQSIYSPFREKALEQIHELFVDYGADGLWLDVPNYPTISYDPWTQAAFRKQYGKSMEEASAAERRMFAVDSIVHWTQEVAATVRRLQPSAVVTYNGAYDPLGSGPRLAIGMAGAVDYFSQEMHTDDLQQERVPVLSQFEKPAEAGYLVSDDWFTPLGTGPVKTAKSEDQIDRVAATVLGGAVNLYCAVTLDHNGATDKGTMELLEEVGAWLRERREYIKDSMAFYDVGIVLGTADAGDLSWPGGSERYDQEVTRLESSFRAAGYSPCRLLNCAHQQTWMEIPSGVRALILPDRVSLTNEDRLKVLNFWDRGGNILAFGRGACLGRSEESPRVADLFGVVSAGYLEPAENRGFDFQWRGKSVPVKPPVIFTRPRSAQVLLWAKAAVEGSFPLLLSNRSGSRAAFLYCGIESGLFEIAGVLEYLWKQVVGEPLWRTDGPRRYRVSIRRLQKRYAVQVTDDLSWRGGPMDRYRPAYSRLHVNIREIPFQRATTVPDDRALKLSDDGIWRSFQIYPNPNLTILLE